MQNNNHGCYLPALSFVVLCAIGMFGFPFDFLEEQFGAIEPILQRQIIMLIFSALILPILLYIRDHTDAWITSEIPRDRYFGLIVCSIYRLTMYWIIVATTSALILSVFLVLPDLRELHASAFEGKLFDRDKSMVQFVYILSFTDVTILIVFQYFCLFQNYVLDSIESKYRWF